MGPRTRAYFFSEGSELKCLALVVALAAATPAHATIGFENGNDLLNSCLGNSQGQGLAFCYGYIEGILDTMPTYQSGQCPPNNIIAQQARDVVINFLQANPAIRHASAESLVAYAIKTAWGCK